MLVQHHSRSPVQRVPSFCCGMFFRLPNAKNITASFCNANRVQLLQILFLPMDDNQHWLKIKHELTWILRISLGGLFGSFVKRMRVRMELDGRRPYIYKYAIWPTFTALPRSSVPCIVKTSFNMLNIDRMSRIVHIKWIPRLSTYVGLSPWFCRHSEDVFWW